MTMPGVVARALSVATVLGVGIALSTAASCHTRPESVSPERAAAYQAALAKYERDSAKYVHDLRVRDSLSRLVNTDSLYHLYHVFITAPDPVPIQALIFCEGFRLMWRYGAVPTNVAAKRLDDTLYTPEERQLARKAEQRLHEMSVAQQMTLGVSPRKCGAQGAKLPEVVDGTRVSSAETLPVRPRKP